MKLSRFSSLFAVILIVASSPRISQAQETFVPVPGSVTVEPTAVNLIHQRQPFGLQVLGASADGYSLDLRPLAKFSSADPKIAAVTKDGWVQPVANGQTEVK